MLDTWPRSAKLTLAVVVVVAAAAVWIARRDTRSGLFLCDANEVASTALNETGDWLADDLTEGESLYGELMGGFYRDLDAGDSRPPDFNQVEAAAVDCFRDGWLRGTAETACLVMSSLGHNYELRYLPDPEVRFPADPDISLKPPNIDGADFLGQLAGAAWARCDLHSGSLLPQE